MFPKVLFSVGNRDYTGDDVISWAGARGDLEPVRQGVRDGLTCSLYAEEEGFTLDKAKLQAASEEIRRRNQLKQAAETERWLNHYGVTVRDFTLYLVRHAWLDRFRPQLESLRPVYVPAPDAISSAFWPELVFGGNLTLFARQLARRLALAWERKSDAASEPAEFQALEQLYLEECRTQVTEETLRRCLHARRQELIRMEYEEAVFPEEAMAQEALMCIRQDGEPLREVAGRIRVPWEHQATFMGQVPEQKQLLLQSARPGHVVGPIPDPGGFRLVLVSVKRDPSLEDSEIREIVSDPLIETFFSEIETRHVTWSEDR